MPTGTADARQSPNAAAGVGSPVVSGYTPALSSFFGFSEAGDAQPFGQSTFYDGVAGLVMPAPFLDFFGFSEAGAGAQPFGQAIYYDERNLAQAPVKQKVNVANASGGPIAAGTAAPDTASAAGTVSVSGTAAITKQKNTAVGAGALPITGTASATQQKNTAAGVGSLITSGTLADSQQANVVQGFGEPLVDGGAGLIQAPNVALAHGIAHQLCVIDPKYTIAANDSIYRIAANAYVYAVTADPVPDYQVSADGVPFAVSFNFPDYRVSL